MAFPLPHLAIALALLMGAAVLLADYLWHARRLRQVRRQRILARINELRRERERFLTDNGAGITTLNTRGTRPLRSRGIPR